MSKRVTALNSHEIGMLAQRFAEFIKVGQYNRIAELLQEAQVTIAQTGNANLANILAAACQISAAYRECQTEKERHQRAFEEVGPRMYELECLLKALLDVVSARESPETAVQLDVAPQPSLPDLVRYEPDHQEPAEHVRLRQGIQSSRERYF